MILPYEDERASQTPSPPQIAYFTQSTEENFSRHAWTHDDVNVSRRLSDIGEELSPARSEGFGDSDEQDLASSPLLHDHDDKNRDNAAWSSSNSTISAGSRRASASRDVPEAHTGRDESPVHPEVARAQATAVVAAEGKGPGEEFSSAILSSEAERILENAKKRLNLMENNLTRARSTTPRTAASPSPSNSGYIQPMGMHQPVGGLYRSIARTDPKSSSLRRQSLIASQDTTNNRHSRVHSETNIPSDSSFANDNKRVSRSVSAMGASTSSSLHTDNRSFQYAPTRAYLTHRSSVSSTQSPIHMNDQGQQDQAAQSPVSTEDSSPDSPHGLGISSEEGSKSSPDGFSPVYSSFGPPSRAQSQLQVRDLQYQMKGLHIKISSLKVKTQEDNLRRRSLQSLRTPSPLTAADHWYANALELRDGQSSRGSNPRRDVSSENTRDVSNDAAADDRRRYDEHAAKNTPKHAGNRQGYEPADYADDQSVAETMYEDAEEGDFDEDIDREALDEILREPLDDDFENDMEAFPDVPSHTDATPHEMREDAFDYEHFILHSALGNYTQQLRRVSNSSNGSVETTRPTYARHSRTNSNMSVSTVATFATANEGERPDDEDDVDSVMYWDRRFNHETYWPLILSHGRFCNSNLSCLVLVSTVRAASITPSVGGINDDDTQMLEALFASLGNVCMDLQAITTSADPDVKAARVLRRRLDAARRVLEGELDA
ncbi:hypothetical protein N7453_010933 [Penicillium expansum]|nr:hypothetical protein N7453_010933 [Penicillium expansum]